MKTQPQNQEIKKVPLKPYSFKLDKKNKETTKKAIENEPIKYPSNYPDEDPGKEFEAGEKDGDFPPDAEMNNDNLKGNI